MPKKKYKRSNKSPLTKNELVPRPSKEWEVEWEDMPAFVQERVDALQEIALRFRTREDVEAFAELIGQDITPQTKFLWFPKQLRYANRYKAYVDENDERYDDEE